MIFKTFDSKIDKWTSKIGIFGKSFNELGTAVNDAFNSVIDNIDNFDEEVGFWESLKDNLFSKKDNNKDWIKNSLEEIISKENIDSYIKELDLESAKEKIIEIFNWNTSIKNGETTWEKFFDTCKGGNEYLIEVIKNTADLSKLTGEDLVNACTEARNAALAQNEAIKAQTLSAKAGKVALQALATVGNMLAMWLISKGIEAAVKKIDEIVHSAEHCKERVDELMSSYQSALSEANANAQTVKELADKYETLSKGVNNLGENVSLTTDEYAEYNKIVNQIANMFPNLILGYTSEGNAILSLKGNVEELRDAYKDAQQEAYNMLIVSGKDSNGNDIVKNFQNTFTPNTFGFDFSTPKEYIADIELLYNAMLDSDESYNKLYNALMAKLNIPQYRNVKKVLKDIGFTSNLSDEDKQNIAKNVGTYIQTYQTEIDSALRNVQTLANAYLMTNEDYASLDEQSQNAASIVVNSINERIASGFAKKEDVGIYVADIVNTIKTNPEVRNALVGLFTDDLSELSPQQAKKVVDQYIEYIAKALDEDELELKIRFGFEDVDTIARNYNTVMWSAVEKFSGVNNVAHYDDDNTTRRTTNIKLDSETYAALEPERAALEAFAEENSINTQDEIAFWNQCIEESETKEEAMEKYLAAFKDFEDDTLVPTISSSISTIATQLEPQFTELGKLYNEIFQTDGNGNKVFSLDSIDNAALESLRKSFAEIGEEIGVTFDPAQLETFFEVLTNGGSEQEVQQAFNDLATAYLYSTGTLEQLNNETANAIEQQLEQMGVTNAEAVVAEALRVKNEELALSKEYLAQYSKELSEATDSEILAFIAEQAEADNCSDALVTLQLKKLLVNGTLLDTETDINNVMRLAQSAGIATETLSQLITLKAAYEEAEEKGNFMTASNIALVMGKLQQDFQDEVNNFKPNPVDIEFKAPDSSKSAASSSAAKQAETDWKNVLDKETDLLEKQLAANVITFKEYTDKRRQIIEDYYRDGRIKAEEYYDALESMYGSQLSLYDKVVNAVTDRIDDEIDRLNEQKEAIENFYQVRIDAIQEEIDALNKANDARQNQIDLEKAQYEAERARNQHVNKVYDGSQFVYAADMEAVRDAEDDLADKDFRLNISRLETQIESLKEEMENATKSLDNQIDALKTYKDKWSEISDVYQRQQDKLLAAEIMGSEWERDVLNGRLDTLRSFTEQYIALQQAQADAAVNAARIKAEAEAGSTTGGNVGNRNTDSNNGNVNAGSKGGLFKQTFETIGETINEGLTKTIDKGLAKTTEKLFASLKEKTTSVEKSKGIAGETLYYAKKYASGTDNAKKGLNLVGEDGTETFIDNDGNVALVTKPTLIPMEGGEVVKNTEETKAMLDTGNIELVQSEGMRALFERIRNMQPSDFSFQSLMQPLSAMVSFPNMDYSHMLHNTSAEPTPVVQHITLTLPNVTNNSGADYLIKTLERLPLDNLQHMHKRKR